MLKKIHIKTLIHIFIPVLCFLSCSKVTMEELGSYGIPDNYKVVDAALQKTASGENKPIILLQDRNDKKSYMLLPMETEIKMESDGYYFGEEAGEFYIRGDYGSWDYGLLDAKGEAVVEDARFIIVSPSCKDYFYSSHHHAKYFKFFWNGELFAHGLEVVGGAFRPGNKSLVLAVRDKEADQFRIRLLEYTRGTDLPRFIGSFILPQDIYWGEDRARSYDKKSLQFFFLENGEFILEYRYFLDKNPIRGAFTESALKKRGKTNPADFEEAAGILKEISIYFSQYSALHVSGKEYSIGTLLDFHYADDGSDFLYAGASSVKRELAFNSNQYYQYSADFYIGNKSGRLLTEELEVETEGYDFREGLQFYKVSAATWHRLGLDAQVGYFMKQPCYAAAIPGKSGFVTIGEKTYKGYKGFTGLDENPAAPLLALTRSNGSQTLLFGDEKRSTSFSKIYDTTPGQNGTYDMLVRKMPPFGSPNPEPALFHVVITP